MAEFVSFRHWVVGDPNTVVPARQGNLVRSGTVMLGLAAATLALACGCSSTAPGTGQLSSGSPTQGSSSSSSDNTAGGAPKVKDPLDTTRWQKDACSTIPATALTAAGNFTPASAKAQTDRPGCGWFRDADSASVGIQFVTDSADGLSSVYSNRSNTTTFKPLMIQGYPAVIYREPTYQKGDCSAAVGVTDKLYFQTDTVTLTTASDPCSVAEALASATLTTMKSPG